MTATVLWSLLGAVLLGVVLMVVGWRGRRLNRHPICRSCGFDLEGTLPQGVTCPECGAGLKRPNAFRVGARRKRWITVAVGVLLVLLPMATIGVVGFGVLTGKDFNTYKPTWLLIWEGKNLGAEASQRAATELEARTFSTQTDPEEVAMIVQGALDIQGDVGRPWNQTWGDIISGAIGSSALSDEDEKRYFDQALVVELSARLRVAAGGSVPVVLKGVEGRIGGGAMLMGGVFLGTCTLDGQEVGPDARAGYPAFADAQLGWIQAYGAAMAGGWGTTGGQAVAALEVSEDIAPGRHELRVAMAIEMIDQSQMVSMGYTWPTEPGEGARVVEATFEIEVVEAGVSTVIPIAATPEMTQRLADVVLLGPITVYGGGLMSSRMANMTVTFVEPPQPLACDVFVRQGEREWAFGSLTTGLLASQNQYGGGWYQQAGSTATVSGVLRGIESGTVEVVLRPSAAVAQRTIDLAQYYDGEIVIEEVEVQNYGASSGFLDAFFEHFSTRLMEQQESGLESGDEAEEPEPSDEGG